MTSLPPTMLAIALLAAGCTSPDEPRARFDVDPGVTPGLAFVSGLSPTDLPRPVGTLRTEDGLQADFVQDEIAVLAESLAALQPLLDRYAGTVVGQVEVRSQGLVSYLVRIDPDRADPDELATDLATTHPEEDRSFAVDSDRSLGLLAAVAHEALTFGSGVDVNWVLKDGDIASGSTEEAPSSTSSGWDQDAFQWPYMSDGSTQDFGVTAAWQLLEQAGRLDAEIPILVVDNGFIFNDDYPDESVFSNLDGWDAPNSGASTHGANVVIAAMGKLDNGYGAAGPAAPVGRLIATQRGGGVWETTQRMRDAIDAFSPRIATMSHKWSTPVEWTSVGPGYVGALDASTALYYDFAAEGIAMFGCAGNDRVRLSSAYPTSRWLAPCQVGVVSCVGGLEWDSNDRATNDGGGSNFSDSADPLLVEFWGPYRVWSIDDATAPNVNQTRRVSGTSYATPFVAGVAALVMAADPSLSASEVRSLLAETAVLVNGTDPRIDAEAAVSVALGLPTIDIIEPNDGYSVPLGTEIWFEAVAEGPDGEDVQLVWDLAGDTEVTNEGTGGRHLLIYDDLPSGTHTITASAQVSGITVSDAIEVT
ncbi:MAG: S8 family serine peptidase, partial [Myxococcota bacterium]